MVRTGMVELRPITDANFRAVLSLDVLPEQRAFVAPAVESLAEAYAYPDAEARAVYRSEGFAENGELDHDELVMVKKIRHAG